MQPLRTINPLVENTTLRLEGLCMPSLLAATQNMSVVILDLDVVGEVGVKVAQRRLAMVLLHHVSRTLPLLLVAVVATEIDSLWMRLSVRSTVESRLLLGDQGGIDAVLSWWWRRASKLLAWVRMHDIVTLATSWETEEGVLSSGCDGLAKEDVLDAGHGVGMDSLLVILAIGQTCLIVLLWHRTTRVAIGIRRLEVVLRLDGSISGRVMVCRAGGRVRNWQRRCVGV